MKYRFPTTTFSTCRETMLFKILVDGKIIDGTVTGDSREAALDYARKFLPQINVVADIDPASIDVLEAVDDEQIDPRFSTVQ